MAVYLLRLGNKLLRARHQTTLKMLIYTMIDHGDSFMTCIWRCVAQSKAVYLCSCTFKMTHYTPSKLFRSLNTSKRFKASCTCMQRVEYGC